jgi:cytochrome c-type biogenesis protein CcmH
LIRRSVVAAVLATGLAGCAERPAPAPTPPADSPRDPAPLRPLTSRDGGGAGAAAPVAAGGAVEGEIGLDARLRDKARPADVLYIIARGSASRQIVAVRKEENVRFPFAFRLSAGDTMMPGTPFEGPFDLTARLSRSGDATPQAGDLEGTVRNVPTGARGVSVSVDTIRP